MIFYSNFLPCEDIFLEKPESVGTQTLSVLFLEGGPLPLSASLMEKSMNRKVQPFIEPKPSKLYLLVHCPLTGKIYFLASLTLLSTA